MSRSASACCTSATTRSPGSADAAPAFKVTATTPNSDDDVALRIDGTFTVPNYLTGDGSPGTRFHYDTADGAVPADDPDAVPTKNPQHPTLQAPFVCIVSKATAAGSEPAHLVEYGHGLLGDPHEIEAGNVRAFADEHNAVVCATAWAGMSEPDVPNAIAALNDISLFPTVVDRLQQGVLNQIFLGRLMTRSGGLSNLGQLRRADGSLMIDTAHLDYDGNSQGGIMGLMLAAVSPDIERAVLGVPGMNYSLLLPRSKDWATYESVLKPAYPNDLDRTFIVSLLQMLWDRGEGAGYAQHVTKDPYEGTKAKPILMHVAFGDAAGERAGRLRRGAHARRPDPEAARRTGPQQGGRTGVGDGRAPLPIGRLGHRGLGLRRRADPDPRCRADRSRPARGSSSRPEGAPAEGGVPLRRHADRRVRRPAVHGCADRVSRAQREGAPWHDTHVTVSGIASSRSGAIALPHRSQVPYLPSANRWSARSAAAALARAASNSVRVPSRSSWITPGSASTSSYSASNLATCFRALSTSSWSLRSISLELADTSV